MQSSFVSFDFLLSSSDGFPESYVSHESSSHSLNLLFFFVNHNSGHTGQMQGNLDHEEEIMTLKLASTTKSVPKQPLFPT
jgi:hypothetical protein